MKKTFAIGMCAFAALALTMGGCSKNDDSCCSSGEKSCCKSDAKCCKDGANGACKAAPKDSGGTNY